VAKTYLTEDNRTVGTFQPTAPPAIPVALGPVVRPFAYRSEASARMGTASIVAPLPQAPADNLAPVAGPVKAPVRQRIPLPNGMVLVVQENRANPTVAVSCSLRAGKGYDLAGKAGVAELTAQLLDRGTKTRTGDAIAAEMEGAAAEISAGTGWETVGLHGKALAGDTELLLRNLADLLRNPIFPADGLDQVREQMLADLAMERDDPAEAARRAFYRAALPANHPYRLHSFDEEEAGLKALTPADLAAFHKARYTPRTAVLTVVGDVSAAEVRTLVERYFGDWRGDMPALLAFPPTPQMPPARVITRIADKTEVDIYVGHAGGLRRTDPNYYAAELMNMILGGGGALNSRLGDVIRDQNGLAYSVYSGFHASTGAGPWYAVLGVNPANTDKAIDLLKAEITRMRNDGATQQEIDDARAYLTGASAIALGTNAALANTLLDTEYFSLGLDYPERLTALYGAVTREQVNAAAKTYLHPDNLTISIAGPYGQ
jgi:zinc protease